MTAEKSGSGIAMACVLPSAIKCPKCDYKGHGQLLTRYRTYCPACFDEFIRQHVRSWYRTQRGNRLTQTARCKPLAISAA